MAGPNARRRLSEGEVMLEAKRRLADHDLRLTPLRRVLLSVFSRANRPLGVQEAMDLAKTKLPLSSVYRNLTVLCDAGVMQRLNFDEGFVRYELEHNLTSHHHHLICSECGRVLDLDDDTLGRVERAIADATGRIRRRHGFAVRSHQVDLTGVCADCTL